MERDMTGFNKAWWVRFGKWFLFNKGSRQKPQHGMDKTVYFQSGPQ